MTMRELVRETNAWACYDCGKCTATCPVARVGGSLSPRRHVLSANLGSEDEVAWDDSLFSCLTCSLCEVRCPAEVGYTALVQRLREKAFDAKVEPECPHGGALQSVMRMMAKGGAQQDRLGWLTQDLKTSPEEGDFFLWTGCTVYYDAFFPELEMKTVEGTKASVRLLNRLGITPVVSPEERCCGHDLLWNGDRASFEALARHNVELVRSSGAETVVTPCAECARTWKLDYEPFFKGRLPQVLHLTELLAERLDHLELREDGAHRVTFQDPCRLGRHLGIYDAPRQLLQAVPGIEFEEMPRSGRRGACCAGGTWGNCDRFAKQIQVDRLREARATGAEVLATACPKCQIHFRCAMKDPNLGSEISIEMKDVAEILAEALV
ncbi:MAG: (Fe-S)-binding protein [Thermoanaerobaculales bacterium]